MVEQTQTQMDGKMLYLINIPSEAFQKLQGLMPRLSGADRKEAHWAAFEGLSKACQDALENGISQSNYTIPSMEIFTTHVLFLEKSSICMKELLGLGEEHVRSGTWRAS